MKNISIENQKNDKSYIYHMAFLFIATVIIGIYTGEFSIIVAFISISALLIILSFKSKFKILLRITSLFIFLHFIIFPYSYVYLLKSDKNSITFDDFIENSERDTTLLLVENQYNPASLENKIKLINKILLANSTVLDTSIAYLNSQNIVSIDTFQVFKSSSRFNSVYAKKNRLPIELNSIDFVISNSDGKFLDKLSEKGYNEFDNQNRTIRQFLEENKNLIENEFVGYNDLKKNIEDNKGYWNYSQILFYSINTENINANTKFANFVWWIHKIVVNGFLFGMLISLLYKLILEISNKTKY
jgi:hypothetical protein